MRIESHGINQINRAESATRAQKADSPRLDYSQESLQLSLTGRLIMCAQKALRALPAVRAAKVGEVETLVSGGRYRANPEAVAQAMIESQSTERGDGS
jgi:flagellar biosynthesis anti-sigma factor FlgM